MPAAVNNRNAVDQHIVNARGVLGRVVKGGRRIHLLRLEHRQVGLGAVADDAPVGQTQPPGRGAGHLADSLLQGKQALAPHELRQYIGIGSVSARVGASAGEDGVGADHLRRVGRNLPDVLQIAGARHESDL